MAIQFDETSRVDIGGSSIRPRNVSQFQNGMGDNGAGDNMQRLAKSLEGLSGAMGIAEENKIKQQAETIDLDVSRVMAGIGDGPIDSSAIDNMLSDKHPVIQARIRQGVGTERAMTWIQSRIESIPTEVRDSPAAFSAAMNQIRQEALTSEASGDNFYGSGFMKTVESTISQYSVNASSSRAARWNDIQDNEFVTRLGSGDPDIDNTFVGGDAGAQSDALLREFEGFRDTPYWDVNAYRTGYGSDTITKADGSVVRVQQGMTVSKEDANRDLSRRRTEFQQGIVSVVGADTWNSLSSGQKAALTSISYNYGSLPKSVARAVSSGSGAEGVAKAIEGLKGHNDGVNANRRQKEANIFRQGGAVSNNVAGNNAYIPRDNYEDAAMIIHRFGVLDPEFKATSSLGNARKRDALADILILRAVDKLDPSYLDSMPAGLMTFELEKKFNDARQHVVTQSRAARVEARAQKEEAAKVKYESAADRLINDRVGGTVIDPIRYATDEKGNVDFELLGKLNDMSNTPLVEPLKSQQNASALQNEIMRLSAKGDEANWGNMRERGMRMVGDKPTSDEIKNFIRETPDLVYADKQKLLGSVSEDMEKGAIIQNPRVVDRYKAVDDLMSEMARDPINALKFGNNTRIKLMVREAYEQSIMDYVADKGVPDGNMGEVLKVAEDAAMAKLDFLLQRKPVGSATPASPTGTTTPSNTLSPAGQAVFDKYKKDR